MYTEGKHLLLTKLPVDTLGAGPKFTQTLSYHKLNCRPAWLPLEKHFMHLLGCVCVPKTPHLPVSPHPQPQSDPAESTKL